MISTQNAWGYEVDNDSAESYDPINGGNLHLTIDTNVQTIVEKYLRQAMDEYDVMNRGTVIVMDVNSGAVLSMATLEQFDPNNPYTIEDPDLAAVLEDSTLTAEEIVLLQSRLGEDNVASIVEDGTLSDEEYTTLQGYFREAQWRNKAVTELYYPGSVFKLITAAAALDSGIVDASQTYTCNGSLTVFPDTEWEIPYRCAEGRTHGTLDMAGALEKSCNLYFIQLAEQMTPEFFYDYFQAFGLAEQTGIDLPAESAGLSKDQRIWNFIFPTCILPPSDRPRSLPPSRWRPAVSAVVNGGYLVTPYVVDHVTDDAGNITSQTQTTSAGRSSRRKSASRCAPLWRITSATGRPATPAATSMWPATASAANPARPNSLTGRSAPMATYHKQISFAAVLPIDDPEYLVFAVLDDPRWDRDYASEIVAPMVGNIISEIAPYLGVPTDPDYVAPDTVLVQNCIDNRWSTAQMNLNKVGLAHQIIGSGNTILYQYPYGGTNVPAVSTIYLYTEATTGTMTTVPDVSGRTAEFAQQMLRAANLNVDFSGDENGRVTAQDIAAGQSVEYGTVVTLTMGAAESDTGDDASSGAASDAASSDAASAASEETTQEEGTA